MASLWHQDGQGGWIEVKKAGGGGERLGGRVGRLRLSRALKAW